MRHLDVDRLLAQWRWLCPCPMSLVARNNFGDMFLRDATGNLFRLRVDIGKLSKVADSEEQFLQQAATAAKREEWFAESDEQTAAARGIVPNEDQCIAFSIPTVFAESGVSNPQYLANIYEVVSFLGDVNRQISDVPDGSKIKPRVGPEPDSA